MQGNHLLYFVVNAPNEMHSCAGCVVFFCVYCTSGATHEINGLEYVLDDPRSLVKVNDQPQEKIDI